MRAKTVTASDRSSLRGGDAAALFGQGAEGDREAELIARRDAVLPIPSRLAREQVSRARLDLEAGAPEAAAGTRWRKRSVAGVFERNADDLLEHIAVAVPADAGAGIVAREQDVDEVVRRDARESSGLVAQRHAASRESARPA